MDPDGKFYASFLKTTNNHIRYLSFMKKLVQELDKCQSNWRDDNVLLIDNLAALKT